MAGGYEGGEGAAGALVLCPVPALLGGASCSVPLPCVLGAAAGAVWDWCGAVGLGAGVLGAGHVHLPVRVVPACPGRLSPGRGAGLRPVVVAWASRAGVRERTGRGLCRTGPGPVKSTGCRGVLPLPQRGRA